jgi:hypothetical protein
MKVANPIAELPGGIPKNHSVYSFWVNVLIKKRGSPGDAKFIAL